HRLAPEAIVVRMLIEGVPTRRLTVKYVLVDVRQRAEIEELVIMVVAAEHIGPSEAALHRADPAECIVEPEGAVVVEIVADEHVGARGLRGGRLQRRMRVDQRAGREKSAVRDSEGPYPAVVPGYVSDDPVDGVIGVGGLVRGFGNALVAHRTQRHVMSGRAAAAPRVLEHEDVAVLDEMRIFAQPRRIAIPAGMEPVR